VNKGVKMLKTVFVVDDSDMNLLVAKQALKDHYRVITMESAIKMFSLMEKKEIPDLILLDIEMPEMNGFEALQRLKNNNLYADIPVIFLTSMTDASVEARGFQLGVIDFVTKPFSGPVLKNRIKTHLDIDALIRERTAQLHEKTIQLQKLKNGIVFVLADMVENYGQGANSHIERTSAYLNILLEEILVRGIYIDEIIERDCDLLVSSARLHDVGKIFISDIILNKPAKLTEEEFEIIKTHTAEGERIIDKIVSRTGSNMEFLHNAKLFAGYHHERWDGKGYPHNLKEKNIPIQGRIMAIVDVYDALTSERPYKEKQTHNEAVKIIMDNAGTQFDPLLTDAFYQIKDKFEAVNK